MKSTLTGALALCASVAASAQTLPLWEAGVVAAAFSRDQRSAFSCDWSGGIRTWDLSQSEQGPAT